MSEWIASAKISGAIASLIGGVVSLGFIKLNIKQRVIAVASGCTMSYYIGVPLSDFVSLPPEPTGFLVGLFGVSICHLIFDGISKSDLSVKFSDIVELFRRGQ